MKKFLACCLSAITLFSFVGCSKSSGDGGNATPQSPVTETLEHFVTSGTLHKVSIQETNKPFIVNGVSDYQILVGESDWIRKAGNYLNEHLKNATGASLPVVGASNVANENWSENAKYIVFGYDAWFTQAGLTMPNEDLGSSGYYIKTVGNTIFVKTAHEFGYQHAVLALLDAMVGYEMYAWDTIVYENARASVNLQNFNVVERPDVDIHASGNNLVDTDAQYGMGFLNRGNAFISVEGAIKKISAHNVMEFLEYAGTKQGVTIDDGWISTAGSFTLTPKADQLSQICYTGGASYGAKPSETNDPSGYAYFEENKAALEERAEETLSALVDTIANVIIEVSELDENKNKTVISFTQEDNSTTRCGCWKCDEEAAYYDNARSASIVKFMNRVNAKVQAYFEEKATATGTQKRNLDLLFFAYQWSKEAPARKNANGEWVAIDEDVICDDNVAVWLAPITADYAESFYEEGNEETKNLVEAWHALSKKTYYWLYQTNFYHYFYPHDSIDAMVETYRLCKENGMTFLYNQGQFNDFACPYSAFTTLKEYVDSKAGFNVNVNLAEITDDFFDNYFGAGSTAMRDYYKQLSAYMDDLKNRFPTKYNGGVYAGINDSEFWKFGTLNTWLGLINDAYKAIATQNISAELYGKLHDHITRESLFIRYVLIDKYADYYSENARYEMKVQFKADCEKLGVKHMSELNGDISNLWAMWGV